MRERRPGLTAMAATLGAARRPGPVRWTPQGSQSMNDLQCTHLMEALPTFARQSAPDSTLASIVRHLGVVVRRLFTNSLRASAEFSSEPMDNLASMFSIHTGLFRAFPKPTSNMERVISDGVLARCVDAGSLDSTHISQPLAGKFRIESDSRCRYR